MRKILVFAVLAGACASAAPKPSANAPVQTDATRSTAQIPAPAAPARKLDADTPMTTTEGNAFIAPSGWSVTVRGPATILEAPEGGSRLALVDVRAESADEAVKSAWAAYDADAAWPLKVVNEQSDMDGWTDVRLYVYQTSPNDRRDVAVDLRRAGEVWTAVIYDMAQAVAEKRLSQVELVFGQLLPRGKPRESFKGMKAHALDEARIEELTKFVETARRELGIPGVSIGLIEDGRVVFEGGFGERELGSGKKPDADTLYMIASNTKALTSLLLAKLVDAKKLTWETPVTSLLPSFKLGDAATTDKVLVKHLICACTGLPRQDFEWLFQFDGVTPEKAMTTLSTMQPTSGFGELFQYSNLLAGSAGFVGGHVECPKLELGAAYDKAMRDLVFSPLEMKATTFDFAKAQKANHAAAHAPDIDGRPAKAVMEINYSIIPLRPAGAAWSNVRDLLEYVRMELGEGALPNGERYISKEALLERRSPQVSIGKDVTYGMGLEVDTTYGVAVVHHGGDMIGYHSDMIWLPEHGIGAVVLTNSDPGWILRSVFRRKLLEVLFDGRQEADAQVAAAGQTYFDGLGAERRLMTVPADPDEAAKLAPRYSNAALGEIAVIRKKGTTVFDFGEWKSEVASRKNPDGTISFVTTTPGIIGFEFVVGKGEKRTLVVRDAQHEYAFSE